MEDFGREPDYGTGEDPVVRSGAAEIRRKSTQYDRQPGYESKAHIDLSSGSCVAAAIVLIVTVALLSPRWKRSDLDRLWVPLLKAPSFARLRDTPAILVAAFDNPWTLRVASQLRSTFAVRRFWRCTCGEGAVGWCPAGGQAGYRPAAG
jgi:hypothetical protein